MSRVVTGTKVKGVVCGQPRRLGVLETIVLSGSRSRLAIDGVIEVGGERKLRFTVVPDALASRKVVDGLPGVDCLLLVIPTDAITGFTVRGVSVTAIIVRAVSDDVVNDKRRGLFGTVCLVSVGNATARRSSIGLQHLCDGILVGNGHGATAGGCGTFSVSV